MIKNQCRFSQIPHGAVLDDRLKPTDFKILAVIGLYLNQDKEAWPTQESIASDAGKSASTVQRSIKILEALGYIRSRKKWPDKPGTHKCYQVVFEPPRTVKNDVSETSKNDASGNPSIERVSGNPSMSGFPIGTTQLNNPKEKCDLFEKAWKLYNSSPLKARQTKKRAAQAWAVAVRKVGADRLMASIAKEVELAIAAKRRTAFHPNLPDMHRWLSQERWADLESAEQETIKPDAPTESQWRSAIEVWMANGRAGWVGGKFGPAPDQPDYFGPEIKPRAAA